MTADEATCRICASTADHPRFVAREMMYGTREEFEYFQCVACECLQISQVPQDLDRHYPRTYYSLSAADDQRCANQSLSLLEKVRCTSALFGRGYKLSKLLTPFVPLPDALRRVGPALIRAGIDSYDAEFLDVGCGVGSGWLRDLRQLGFKRLLGVDPMIDADIRADGIRILKREIADIAGTFSLITFHHSLEHIADQLATLRRVSQLLKPGRTCLVRIPTVSSYAWEKYGVNWVEMDPPRHLYLHSRKSIELVATMAGLQLEHVSHDSGAFEFYGSEQYVRDIPLNDERSHWPNPGRSIFTDEDIRAFEEMARDVNQRGVGGRAAFYFKKPTT